VRDEIDEIRNDGSIPSYEQNRLVAEEVVAAVRERLPSAVRRS